MIRLRDSMREDLELRGFRANTIDIYLRCARRFVDYFNLPPSKLGAAEVRRFGLHLLREAGVSSSTVNVYAAAIRFLYCVTLKRPEVVTGLVHVKTPMRLPRVLSGVEVARLLAALPTERYRVMGMLAYGAGLRVGEIVRLEIGDIDAKRTVLHIRDAKRGRERYVMLLGIRLGDWEHAPGFVHSRLKNAWHPIGTAAGFGAVATIGWVQYYGP